MARIEKKLKARVKTLETAASSIIDTGAEVSVLPQRFACNLAVNEHATGALVVTGFGGKRVGGLLIPVTLTVDAREAEVTAFVPTYRVVGRKGAERLKAFTKAEQKEARDAHALVGDDFLRKTGAMLDYSKAPGSVFSGVQVPTEKISPRLEKLLLARGVRCSVAKRPRKR